ncbi:hypothetical protein GCM10022214_02570 [Actinomadura miaoliensis]|uniref:Uncharacterized protein n=1 Tax=Actinomadura miaoliensis TaxID=430685 RepID=A0ABP7UXE0_9ACTN
MRIQVKNRLVMTKGIVSARLESSSSDRYAWVWVSPLRNGTFRVSTVEIPKRLIDEGDCFGEEDVERVHVRTVVDIPEIDEVVRGLGVDPDALDAPWHSDFPL